MKLIAQLQRECSTHGLTSVPLERLGGLTHERV
jgi:hypothetical protein